MRLYANTRNMSVPGLEKWIWNRDTKQAWKGQAWVGHRNEGSAWGPQNVEIPGSERLWKERWWCWCTLLSKRITNYCLMMVLVAAMHLNHCSQKINYKRWFGRTQPSTEFIQDLQRIAKDVYCPQNMHDSNTNSRANSPSFRSQNVSIIKKGCSRWPSHGNIHTWICTYTLFWKPRSWGLFVPSRPNWLRVTFEVRKFTFLRQVHWEPLMYYRPSFEPMFPFRGPLIRSPGKSKRRVVKGITDHSQCTESLDSWFFLLHWKYGNSPVNTLLFS